MEPTPTPTPDRPTFNYRDIDGLSAEAIGLKEHARRETRDKALEDTGIPKPSSISKLHSLTQTGNAERLIARFGHYLRYCHSWDKWLFWNRSQWEIDEID